MARRDLAELKLDPEDEHYRNLVFLSDSGSKTYVKFSDQSGYLHRRIMNCPDDVVVDHKNGDSLDNRKSNMRIVSHAENCRNKDLSYRNSFGHQGIDFMKSLQKYRARIHYNYKEYHLGVFLTLEEAINARITKEKELWGIQPQRKAALNE